MIALAVSRATAIEGMQLRPVKDIALISKRTPVYGGGQNYSDSLLEFCDFTLAVHVAIAINLFAADFPVEAHPILLDVCHRGVAFIDALLLSGAEVDKGV